MNFYDMAESYIGAIDQGTVGSRFMLFDHDGNGVVDTHEGHEQIHPKSGWDEHDATEIWERTKTAVRSGLDNADFGVEAIDAIGIANQRETAVVWDALTGEPIYNAIVWRDRRTTDRIEELEAAGKADWIQEKTGVKPDAYFSATKVEWILDTVDGARERAEAGDLRMGTIDSWLIYNLTGEHVTDVSNASRTMLYNIYEMAWDDELLAEFGVPKSMLPTVRPSSDDDYYGYTAADGFLGAEVPVTGALGDQQAALVGQACFDTGQAKKTYGTGSFFLMNTGEEAVESDHGLITTISYQLADEPVQYALEGAVFITGAAIEWLGDVGLSKTAAHTAKLARSVDSTDGVYLVPAFAGLGAPHWDRRARGTVVGITRGTRREHLVRATLEAIAYQTRDVAEAMERDSGRELTTIRIDGSLSRNNFLSQLQSNIVQTTIERSLTDETTALGAAYMAGLAVDYWESIDDFRNNWQVEREFSPELDAGEADRLYDRWNEAVERAKHWAAESYTQ